MNTPNHNDDSQRTPPPKRGGKWTRNIALMGTLAAGCADLNQSTDTHPGVIDTLSNCTEALVYGDTEAIVTEEATRLGVDVNLAKAQLWTESSCNPNAQSSAGAQGLMQLNSKYHKLENPYDPKENIKEGVKELARLLKKYDNNVELALAAYNAGEGAVKKAGGVPNFPETKNYIQRILQRKKILDTLDGVL